MSIFAAMRIKAPFIVLILLLANAITLPAQPQEKLLASKEDSLKLLLGQVKQDTAKLNVLLNLVNLYQNIQPQKTFQWIDKAKSIAESSNNHDRHLLFYLMEMRSKGRLGLYADALQTAERAAYLLEKSNLLPRTTAGYHLQKGQVHYKLGAYEKAAAEFNLTVDIAKKNQMPDVEVKVLNNLTLVQEVLEKYPEMRVQFLRALAVAQKAGLGEDAAQIKINLAMLESRTNNYGKAIEYLQDALPYFQLHHNDVSVALCYANLSWGYLQIKDYPKTLQNARLSLAIREPINDQAGMAKLHIIFGQAFLETNQYDSSMLHLNKGIAIASKLMLPQYLKDAYKAQALLYERTKRYQDAYQSFRSYSDWKDTVFQQDKQKQLIQQLNIYKSKYVDSLVQQKDNIITKQRASLKRFWLMAVLAVLLLVLGCYWLYRKWRHALATAPEDRDAENNQLRQELELLNGEIKLLHANLKQETREDLVNLRRLVLESNLQTEGYWNEFLLLFSKVFPNFFEQLKTSYPQLTLNELRICSLMKLNLSLLEIANLLNITTESGRKARYRIYKKMDLTSDKELAEKLLML